MTAPLPPDWVALHRLARAREGECERLLSQYEGIPAANARGAAAMASVESGEAALSHRREHELASSLQAELAELRRVRDAMRVHPEAAAFSSAMVLRRLSDALDDAQRRFSKLHGAYEAWRRSSALLAGRVGDSGTESSARDELARENSRLQHAHEELDATLQSLAATENELGRQTTSLDASARGLVGIAARVPVFRTLMTSITNHRSRNAVILATVIAACVCFFLWYFVLRHLRRSPDLDEGPADLKL